MNTIIKSLRITLLTIVCLLGLGSCTTNNGDIGNLYGRWNLVSVDIDGVEQNEWKQNGEKFCNWYFQNNIVEIQQSDKRHDNSSSYGTWTRGED